MRRTKGEATGRGFLVAESAALVVGIGGLALAVYELFPGVKLDETWFRSALLALLGAVLLEVTGERRILMLAIRTFRARDRTAGPFESRERIYSEASRLILETSPETEADSILLLSSLHGHTGPRIDPTAFAKARAESPSVEALWTAIEERLKQNWQMRHVITFTSEERLDAFLPILDTLPKASRLEVRALVEDDRIPAISALVVARKTAILATDDDQVFGVGAGLRLDGPELARWVEAHFEELWRAAPYTLWQPASGRHANQIEELRGDLQRVGEDFGSSIIRGGSNVYAAATRALDDAVERPEEIEILLANLHGLGGPPRAARPDLEQRWIQSFEAALDRCLLENPVRCRMRAIYNVNSEERLRVVENYLSRWSKADRLEIRALVLGDAVAAISPLIIGGQEFFLGTEDDRLYRSARSLRLQGKDAADWGREYFDLVWNDKRAIHLRTVNGTSPEGLAELKRRLVIRPPITS